MLKEIAIRVVVGGVTVSTFAILADMLKPKSFAGLFAAAPSIALATLILTVLKDGRAYAAIEVRSMALGALAFLLYAYSVTKLLLTGRWSALRTTVAALLIWFLGAFGLWRITLR